MTLNFNASREDHDAIARIAKRARVVSDRAGVPPRQLVWWIMDLTLAHNACPLDLAALEAASDGNFAHDVFGIANHLDRKTGEIGDGFLPRCAKLEI